MEQEMTEGERLQAAAFLADLRQRGVNIQIFKKACVVTDKLLSPPEMRMLSVLGPSLLQLLAEERMLRLEACMDQLEAFIADCAKIHNVYEDENPVYPARSE